MSGIILLNCWGHIKLAVSVILLQLRISICIEINVAVRNPSRYKMALLNKTGST